MSQILNLSRLFFYVLILSPFWLETLPCVYGQTLREYEKAAEKAFQKGDYFNSAFYYEQVLKTKKTPQVYYQYAEGLRLAHSYQKSATAYEEVLKSTEKNKYELLHFQYATVLKTLARYEEAAKQFELFAKAYPKQDFYQKKAAQELKSCQKAQILAATPNDSVYINRLGDNINTEFSDFAPSTYDSGFYYSSLRFERERETNEKKEKNAGKRLISKLLVEKNTGDKNSKPNRAELIAELNLESKHAANLCWDTLQNRVFYTVCEGKSSDSIVCEIWSASYSLQMRKFLSPVRLNPNINAPASTNTHPNIAYIDGKTYLFFASDRIGGQGRLDIWGAELGTGLETTRIFNLGEQINSADDEITPFYEHKTGILYFSSAWHEGMGGYDIFKTVKKEGLADWQAPENMGLPFNSAANDLYFVKSDDTTGYISSNRVGSMTLAGESCCNDIYKYGYKPNQLPKTDTTPKIDTTPTIAIKTGNNPPVKTGHDPSLPTRTPDPLTELNKMLPLRLYFHNDEPDSNTTATTTNKPYELPYQDYIGLKNLYRETHANQFAPETRAYAVKKVEDFFELDVKGEYNRMNAFYEKVLELLESGLSLEITIKGFTSPRTTEKYNHNLAQRRITSVRKQLFIYKNGVFLRYFQQGKLAVKESPIGETQSPAQVSDVMEDVANSIYSVEASRERRAEIIVIQQSK